MSRHRHCLVQCDQRCAACSLPRSESASKHHGTKPQVHLAYPCPSPCPSPAPAVCRGLGLMSQQVLTDTAMRDRVTAVSPSALPVCTLSSRQSMQRFRRRHCIHFHFLQLYTRIESGFKCDCLLFFLPCQFLIFQWYSYLLVLARTLNIFICFQYKGAPTFQR